MTTDVRATQATLSERVAEEIRGWMGKRRITGAELSRQLGVSQMWVSDRLKGKTAIDLNDLEAIARILRVKLVELLPNRPDGTSPWYEHAGQAAIGRATDQATRRPRDSRPANRPSGPLNPIASTDVRRPRRRYAMATDVHQRLTTEKIPA